MAGLGGDGDDGAVERRAEQVPLGGDEAIDVAEKPVRPMTVALPVWMLTRASSVLVFGGRKTVA